LVCTLLAVEAEQVEAEPEQQRARAITTKAEQNPKPRRAEIAFLTIGAKPCYGNEFDHRDELKSDRKTRKTRMQHDHYTTD